MNRRAALGLAIWILAGRLSAGQELRFEGSLRNHSLVYSPAEPDDSSGASRRPLLGLSKTRLRLALTYAPAATASFLVAYDISPRIQDPLFFRGSAFPVPQGTASYRLADLKPLLLPANGRPSGRFGLYHNLDRLSVSLRMKFGDLVLGRQSLAWGSGQVTNPTDVITPFAFFEPDREARSGADAVRLRVPLSALGEIDAGCVFGEKLRFRRSAFFLRAKTQALRTDLALTLLGFQEDLLLGLDLARSLGGTVAWLESAFVVPKAWGSSRSGTGNYGRVTLGIRQGWGPGSSAFLEYHYNSAGAPRPEAYGDVFARPAYTRGSVYFLGRHYLSAGTTCQVSPLVPVTGTLIWNVADGSWILFPQAEYNVAEDLYLAAGACAAIGRRPASAFLGDPAVPPDFRSEFGSYPGFAFLSLRIYF